MKEGWDYKKLGEVTSTINGLWTGKKPPFINIAVVRNTNFTKDCKLDMTNVAYLDVEEKQFSTRKLQYGDIIIEKSGGSEKQPVGRPVLFNIKEGNYSFSNFTSTLRINNKSELDPHFLHYSLLGAYFRGATSKMQAKTTGIHNLDFKAYLRLLIPIPTIEEQQQIVSELDLLSGVIEKQKAQLEELDKLAQSIFYDMFGDPVTNEKKWDVKKLSEVSKEKLSYGSGASAIPYDGELRYIRITDIKDNGELNEDVVSPNQIDEKYILREGDILFARSGATVGKTYRHREEYGKCLYAGYLIRLVPNIEMVMPTYVFGYTKTSYYLEFVRNAQNAVAQPNINAKQYGHLLICVPPLSLQQEFAAKVGAIEAMKAKVRQSLKEAETLFNERMDYYFN